MIGIIVPPTSSSVGDRNFHLWVKPELESSFPDAKEESPAQGRDLETGRINLSLGSLQTLDQVIDGPVEGEGDILRKGRHRQVEAMSGTDRQCTDKIQQHKWIRRPISSTCQASPLPTGATDIM